MAEMRGAARYANKQQWARDNRKRAKELLQEAQAYQNELFEKGDLTPYLDILSRMNYQNSRNLLLLLKRFPQARCLTGFRIWQRRIPDPLAPVLRTGQKGRGIELLVPFTDLSNNSMTWYAALHFDVSQVNVSYKVPAGPYVPSSSGHLSVLLTALHSVLGEHYKTSISTAEDPEDLEVLNTTNAEGIMLPGYFLLRPNLPDAEKLRWLTESVCRLYLQHNKLPSEYENYISLCAAQCLFTTWGIPSLSLLRVNPVLVMSVPPEERQTILELLQRCVYTLDMQIRAPYAATLDLESEISAQLTV